MPEVVIRPADMAAVAAGVRERVVPAEAIPAQPLGIRWWQSRAFVGACVSAVFGLIAAAATILQAFGLTEAAAFLGTAREVNQIDLASAVTTIAQVVGGAVSLIAGVIAAQGRYNGGQAASPIK